MQSDLKIYTFIIATIVLVTGVTLTAGCSGTTKMPGSPGSNVTNVNLATDNSPAPVYNSSGICGNCSSAANNESCNVSAASAVNEHDSRVRLTMDDARAIALDYVKSHYEGFQTLNMTLSNAKLLDHGSGGVEYYFVWTEMIAGAFTLNNTVVSVNATSGNINKYYEMYGPAPLDLTPSISRDQAIAIATGIDYFKNYRPASVDATLYTGYGSRPQRLIWRVDVLCDFNETDPTTGMAIPDHRGGQVTVDAITGDVVDVNPCR